MKVKFCQPTLLTHDGQTLSIRQWADRLGVNRQLIYGRLAAGWTPTDALSFAPRQRDKRHEVNGELLTLAQCAERAGVSYGTFVSRIARGMTLAEGIQQPKGKHRWHRRWGVSSDLGAILGTGGGPSTQETLNIDFSQDATA